MTQRGHRQGDLFVTTLRISCLPCRPFIGGAFRHCYFSSQAGVARVSHRLSPVLIGGIVAVAFTQVASAADLPRKAPAYASPTAPPVFSWSGFYIGGHVGGLWGDKDRAFTNVVGIPIRPSDSHQP
jgi:hypothetical protein